MTPTRLAAALAVLFTAPAAFAATTAPSVAATTLPTGGHVVHGQAGIAQSANQLTVTQGSDKAVINWQTFSIGEQARVQFVQPGPTSITLNRVLSAELSQIYGQLSANGQVWLANPNGVIVGPSGRIDVGGLVLAAGTISDENFLAGEAVFAPQQGPIVIEGRISATGSIALFSGTTVAIDGSVSPGVVDRGVRVTDFGRVSPSVLRGPPGGSAVGTLTIGAGASLGAGETVVLSHGVSGAGGGGSLVSSAGVKLTGAGAASTRPVFIIVDNPHSLTASGGLPLALGAPSVIALASPVASARLAASLPAAESAVGTSADTASRPALWPAASGGLVDGAVAFRIDLTGPMPAL